MLKTCATPLDEYAARKRDREAAAAARERTHIHLGNAKVAIFIAAVIYGGYVAERRSLAGDLRHRRGRVHRVVDLARGRDARAGARAGRGHVLRRRHRAHRGPLDARHAERRAFSRSRCIPMPTTSTSSARQPVPAAVVVPHADGRGAAGRRGCCARRRSPTSASARRASPRCATASICASASPSSMPAAGDRCMPSG